MPGGLAPVAGGAGCKPCEDRGRGLTASRHARGGGPEQALPPLAAGAACSGYLLEISPAFICERICPCEKRTASICLYIKKNLYSMYLH
jgi:hypothetical protein